MTQWISNMTFVDFFSGTPNTHKPQKTWIIAFIFDNFEGLSVTCVYQPQNYRSYERVLQYIQMAFGAGLHLLSCILWPKDPPTWFSLIYFQPGPRIPPWTSKYREFQRPSISAVLEDVFRAGTVPACPKTFRPFMGYQWEGSCFFLALNIHHGN